VAAALEQYLKERPLFRSCCPEQELFVNPIFNLQRYAPGEGFKRWHCDWTISDEGEVTEPAHRVLAWILYCDSVPEGTLSARTKEAFAKSQIELWDGRTVAKLAVNAGLAEWIINKVM
jgi:hypothetical protein